MTAAVVQAFGAGGASVVVDDGLDDDAVAWFVFCHAIPDGFDSAAEFVAEC